MSRRGFSVAPLVILGLVAGAAILLIAGYGAPVGVGLLIGLGLGGAVGLVGVLWIGAGPGRSVNLGSFTFSSDLAAGGGPFELPDWMRDSQRVIGVDSSPLRQVIVLGQRVEAAGVTVEFTALELREAGGVALALVYTAPPNAPASFARLSVTDDLGSSYVAAANPGSGGPLVARFELRFAPAPPPAAKRLVVRIEEFGGPFPPRGPRRIEGPWELVVALPEGDGLT